MKQLSDWIPAFAGMTVHPNNRKLRSIEDSFILALMPIPGRAGRAGKGEELHSNTVAPLSRDFRKAPTSYRELSSYT
jgi:hypothetical protein